MIRFSPFSIFHLRTNLSGDCENMDKVVLALLLLCGYAQAKTQGTPFLLQSTTLPSNRQFMPSLSNGHLGFNVFGPSIYMNGVYNGRGGLSHRARFPNWLNISIAGNEKSFLKPSKAPEYFMNIQDGYFSWFQNFDEFSAEQRTYAHRYFNRALIYELIIRRSKAKKPLSIRLNQCAGNYSEDFNYVAINNPDFKFVSASTKIVENKKFQDKRTKVFVAFSENFDSKVVITLPAGQKELHYRFVITADTNRTVALKEMNSVLSLDPSDILVSHAAQWRRFWEDFSIDIPKNVELSQIVNSGIFYLVSSLPSLRSHQALQSFYGLSPSGLAFGDYGADYQGHSFWDTEIWMLPAVMQMSSEWSKMILQYRIDHIEGARHNAQLTGYKGARFPWESAFTGTEVTNPCCPEGPEYQIHITPDIAFAVQQHYAMTNDRKWLCSTAWPIVQQIANFLVSRVTYTPDTNQYHLNNVMGPDEDHFNVSDSVYTNVVSKMALDFAVFAQELCYKQSAQNSSAKWADVAKNMFILYDPVKDYHPEYIGYEQGVIVKQADVVLLGYPLQFAMNASTRLNDLNAYENVTRSTGPAMTWSMFAINSLDVQEIDQADSYFKRGYQDYVEDTWKVWGEAKLGQPGANNFITGVGGFLQAIINGYAGVRFHRQGSASVMEVNPANVLPGTKGFTIKGLKFGDARFNLQVLSSGVSVLECTDIGTEALVVFRGDKVSPMTAGLKVSVNKEPVRVGVL